MKVIIRYLSVSLSQTCITEIDKLLGDPIQRDLEFSTGIQSSLDAMNGICSTNYEIIHRIQILHDSIAKAILISHDAFTRLEELQTQLTVLQRQCVGRDRALCETLKIKSMDETNIIGKLIKVYACSHYQIINCGNVSFIEVANRSVIIQDANAWRN